MSENLCSHVCVAVSMFMTMFYVVSFSNKENVSFSCVISRTPTLSYFRGLALAIFYGVHLMAVSQAIYGLSRLIFKAWRL